MSNYDPRSLLATSPMSRLQIIAVIITIALNALDGFDVLAISFASPGIMKEWGIDRLALGVVVSMELWGMAVGSFVLGGFADKYGRRPAILSFLVVMTIGMYMASRTQTLYELSFWRFFTGLGIGGMLAAINATAAEFSNDQRRNFWVALMTIGYPIGNILGALVVADLLQTRDWRAVFEFGAAATAALIPIVWFLVPESVSWLCRAQPKNALGRINHTLKRMGREAISALPPLPAANPKIPFTSFLTPELFKLTALLMFAYFTHITSFYFIIKWVAPISAKMGFPPSVVADVLFWASVGGATGGAILGLLATRFSIKWLSIGVLVCGTGAIIVFGGQHDSLEELKIIVCICGMFTNAGVVGLYTILAQAFPTHLRATGTGIVIGAGRGGAALAPILAGALFEVGATLQTVAIVMGMGSLLGAITIFFVKYADTSEANLTGAKAPG